MVRYSFQLKGSIERWLCGLVVVVLSIGMLATTSYAQTSDGIYRVALSGSDVPGCGTVAQPCRNAYYAVLESIVNSSYAGEIRIAGGTYTQARSSHIIPITVYGSNLRITGGFSTSNWSVSDPATNPTILDGQNANRGIVISTDNNTAQICNITISNLTITRGRGTAEDPAGAGILVDNCKNATVSNVVVQNSVSRGGDNTNADGSRSPGTGGGIAVRGNASVKAGLTLTNVTVQNNQAVGGNETVGARGGLGVGGGIFAINANIHLTNVTVTGNTAKAGDSPGRPGQLNGQIADGIGGGITAIDCPSVVIDGLTAANNTVRGGNAAGIGGYALGGGLAFERDPSVTISNSTISGNQVIGGNASNGTSGGTEGGGIHGTGTTLLLTNVALLHNSATTGTGNVAGQSYGGGLFMTVAGDTSSVTAANLIVAANQVTGAGVAAGGGIGFRSTAFDLSHVTLANNSLTGGNELGQALLLQGPAAVGTMRNSISSGHSGSNSFYGDNSPTGTISRLLNNDTTTLVGGSGITTQNVSTGNPAFVSPGSPNYNYHIGFGSAAINLAVGSTTTSDIDKQPRPISGTADLGADEYQIALATVASNGSISLDWDAPPGAPVTSYQVQYTKDAGAANATEGSPIVTGSGTTGTPMSNLTQGAKYTITVIAFNGGSEVARSRTAAVIAANYPVYLPVVVR